MRVCEADHWEEGAEEIAEGEFTIDAKTSEDGGGFLRSGCVHGYIIAYLRSGCWRLFPVLNSGPLDILDEEGFQGAVDVGDEVEGVEENRAEAEGGVEAEVFAFDEFDGDEHEDEVDQCEGGESGEESDAGLAAGAEFDETAEEHNDDADENHDDGFDADGLAAEAAGVGGVGRDARGGGA